MVTVQFVTVPGEDVAVNLTLTTWPGALASSGSPTLARRVIEAGAIKLPVGRVLRLMLGGVSLIYTALAMGLFW